MVGNTEVILTPDKSRRYRVVMPDLSLRLRGPHQH